jgi:hypothetical protein
MEEAMQPIKVEYMDDGTRRWGLWIDTIAHNGVMAVLLPIGNENPTPITLPIDRVRVMQIQNEHLELAVPRI